MGHIDRAALHLVERVYIQKGVYMCIFLQNIKGCHAVKVLNQSKLRCSIFTLFVVTLRWFVKMKFRFGH